jgi:hypothetical protein
MSWDTGTGGECLLPLDASSLLTVVGGETWNAEPTTGGDSWGAAADGGGVSWSGGGDDAAAAAADGQTCRV